MNAEEQRRLGVFDQLQRQEQDSVELRELLEQQRQEQSEDRAKFQRDMKSQQDNHLELSKQMMEQMKNMSDKLSQFEENKERMFVSPLKKEGWSSPQQLSPQNVAIDSLTQNMSKLCEVMTEQRTAAANDQEAFWKRMTGQ
jgi:hypothetical protein